MERFELEEKLQDEIRQRVAGDGFMKIVQTVRRNGETFKISLRPVELSGMKKFQAEMVDGGQVQVRNLSPEQAKEGLEEIIRQKGARELHLLTATGDLHVRVTKKGHVLVSRSGALDRVAVVQPHDRVKKVPLNQFESSALLRTIGLTDGSGQLRASMRGKYDQVNEFLKVVGATVPAFKPGAETTQFVAVDCGCGKAYLTISLYYYLTEVLHYPSVRIIGVDRRADVIESAKQMSAQLDLQEQVVFVESDLAQFNLERADLVVSLHACDTATDEALAKGIEWRAAYILSAPCCQHELQKTITASTKGEAATFSGLLRQNILRERLCDILTDAFRAMILRILGYKVQVIEFVSSEATARNILLKCEAGVKPGQPAPVGEYLSLRDYWRVTPWLESRLAARLDAHLSRFQ